MDSTSHNNRTKHHQKSSSELLSSAKYVAEEDKHPTHHESDKVDKGRVAGAAAYFLGAASQYDKMEEKSFELNQVTSSKTMRDTIVLEEGLFEDVENVIIASPHRQRVECLTDIETRNIHSELYRAAQKGKWDIAEGIFNDQEAYVSAKISTEGNTALHIAAASRYSAFGIKLLEKMGTEDVLTRNNAGYTAFCLAAASGNVELALKMMEKEENLALTKGGESELPVCMAALNGHKEMVRYLYEATVDLLSGEDRIELLITLIKASFFDVAIQLVRRHPDTATKRDTNGETALHSLARVPLIRFPGIGGKLKLLLLGFMIDMKMPITGVNVETQKKPTQAIELVELLWEQVMLLSDSEILDIIRKPWSLIFAAAKHGNVEFLKIIFYDFPDLIFEADENHYTIFHLGVQYRQANIFGLIHEIGSLKDLVIGNKDERGNTILHLAAMLHPQERLNAEEDILFHLQMEMVWFEEVRRILPQTVAEVENEDGKTARVLFNEKHEKLREEGEKWIKDCANSGLVAATIITSVTFAAVLTVPGGTKQDKGTPNLVGDPNFKAFVFGDAFSLVLSTLSILFFLFIFRSRFRVEDFFESLPLQLYFAVSALHFSVLLMWEPFIDAICILFKFGKGTHLIIAVPFYYFLMALCSLLVFSRIFRYTLILKYRGTYLQVRGTLSRITNTNGA